MPYPYPSDSVVIGPAVHPVDGQPGTALRLATGVEVLFLAGAVRSLPRDWRDRQPGEPSAAARVIAASQGG